MANIFEKIEERSHESANGWSLEEELVLVRGLVDGKTIKQIAADVKSVNGRDAEQSLMSYKARQRGLKATRKTITEACANAKPEVVELLAKYGFTTDDFVS